jgi:hypothetical protein
MPRHGKDGETVTEYVLGERLMCCTKHLELGWFAAEFCPKCGAPKEDGVKLIVTGVDYGNGVIEASPKGKP